MLTKAQMPPVILAALLQDTYSGYRDGQTVLHFVTANGELGPGQLVRWDIRAETVTIQLRGETSVYMFTFTEINDFGIATYESPITLGKTLLGTFWDARVARKYLERVAANAYARLAPEEVDFF